MSGLSGFLSWQTQQEKWSAAQDVHEDQPKTMNHLKVYVTLCKKSLVLQMYGAVAAVLVSLAPKKHLFSGRQCMTNIPISFTIAPFHLYVYIQEMLHAMSQYYRNDETY